MCGQLVLECAEDLFAVGRLADLDLLVIRERLAHVSLLVAVLGNCLQVLMLHLLEGVAQRHEHFV